MAHTALFRQCAFIATQRVLRNVYHLPVQTRSIKRWAAPTLRELEHRRKKAGPPPPNPRSGYLEWNYDAEVYAFSKRLREEFNDSLLKQAFTHRSYIIKQEIEENSESSQNHEDNRQLIQEGEILISNYITKRFQDIYPKEVVDALRLYLTTEEMLAHVAFYMGVKDLIQSADSPPEKRTLADTFKAIVAALRHSSGEERAELFIMDLLVCQLNGKTLYDVWSIRNPYEYLLKVAKEKGYAEIEPRLCNQSAVNTILANYQVGLYNNKKLLGTGWGESVEIAKDAAALNAIQKLNNLKELQI